MELGEKRYDVDHGRIREGIVVDVPGIGFGVDWGEGKNFHMGHTHEEATQKLEKVHAILAAKRAAGQEKWGAHGEGAWIIRRCEIHPVRLGERGDLVSQLGWGIMAYAENQKWPKLFTSQEAATRAMERMRQTCAHAWRWISHEERECSRCGEIEFIPDVD